MPRYAHFDHTQPAPRPVIGWFDTDAFDYVNPPPPDDMLEVTSEQWAARLPGQWAVDDNGALVPGTPRMVPPP